MRNDQHLPQPLAWPRLWSRPAPARVRRHFLGALALCLALCSLHLAALAQAPATTSTAAASEERVKGVSIYKFLNYVEWPASAFDKPDSPYVIGVLGADEVADELARVAAGRTMNNRGVIVKRLQAGESFNGIHVLFIGKGERARQAQILKQVQLQPKLLITETDGALAQGSMINFKMVDERVRFEVALDPVEKSGLKLNSRMLAVALSVIKGAQP